MLCERTKRVRNRKEGKTKAGEGLQRVVQDIDVGDRVRASDDGGRGERDGGGAEREERGEDSGLHVCFRLEKGSGGRKHECKEKAEGLIGFGICDGRPNNSAIQHRLTIVTLPSPMRHRGSTNIHALNFIRVFEDGAIFLDRRLFPHSIFEGVVP